MVYGRYNYSGWWYTYPSEKYEFVSWDDERPNLWKNKTCSKTTTNDVHGVYKVTSTWGASSWGNIAEQTRGNICGVPTMKQLTWAWSPLNFSTVFFGKSMEVIKANINSWASIVTRLVMDYPPVN